MCRIPHTYYRIELASCNHHPRAFLIQTILLVQNRNLKRLEKNLMESTTKNLLLEIFAKSKRNFNPLSSLSYPTALKAGMLFRLRSSTMI